MLLATILGFLVVSTASSYDIVLSPPPGDPVATMEPDVDTALLDELAATMISNDGNISCYCSPENTTVACNDTDVEPLQESSLIPDNAQFLYISSNRINYDHIGQGNFTRTLNITEIILKNCGVAEILPASFRPLKSLKHFELADNSRPVVVRDDAFAGADLDSLFLHKLNGGLLVKENSFRDALIKTLVMVACRLGDVPKLNHNTLSDSLTTLYLSNNNIVEISGWAFAGLRNLRRVFLDANNIRGLLPKAFDGVNLELLDLSRNFGISLHRSSFAGARVSKLLLSSCGLKNIAPGSLSPIADSLVELDLSGNGLVEIDAGTFSGLVNLRVLDMANNSGLVVGPKSFAFTKQLTRVDLSDCTGLKVLKGAFCKAIVEELYVARSTGVIDYSAPLFIVPLLTPKQGNAMLGDFSGTKPESNLRILDAAGCGIRSLPKSEFWKVALSTVSEEIRLAGNPISCSDPQTAVLVSRFKEKLVDICDSLRRYALLMPQMHSELTLNEVWLTIALGEECRAVYASETVLQDYEPIAFPDLIRPNDKAGDSVQTISPLPQGKSSPNAALTTHHHQQQPALTTLIIAMILLKFFTQF